MMEAVFIHIRPWDRVLGERVDVYVASAPGAAQMGLGGIEWQPAVTKRPELTLDTMDPDLTGRIQPGKASLAVALQNIANVVSPELLYWTGSPITIWSADDQSWDRRVLEFKGKVTDADPDKVELALPISAEVDTTMIEKALLRLEWDGSGGAGGDAGMYGKLKPAGFGHVENIEPIWFDSINNIGMIDGYGNTVSIDWLGEGLSSFGPSVDDYATYALLRQAIIDKVVGPGQWGTCVAQGMVGLGAPPAGVITVHAHFGANRAGLMMKRMLLINAQVDAGSIDGSTFDDLDGAYPYETGYWTADQRQVDDLLTAIAGSCNATPLVTWQAKVVISQSITPNVIATLDYSGAQEPRVTAIRTAESAAPYYRMQARTARPGKVLTNDQVNYADDLIDRGLFSITETYRQGNLVRLRDGSQFLYINESATAGHAPPAATVPPADPAANAYWQQRMPPRIYPDGTTFDALQPAAPGATPGAPAGTDIGGVMDPVTGEQTGGVPAADIGHDYPLTLDSLFSIIKTVGILNSYAQARTTLNGKQIGIVVLDVQSVADSAVEQLSLIGAKNFESTAFVLDLDTVKVTPDTSLAQQFSSTEAAIGDLDAAVTILTAATVVDGVAVAKFQMLADADGVIVGISGATDGTLGVLDFGADMIRFIDPATGDPMLEFDTGTGKLVTHKIVVDEVEAGSISGTAMVGGSTGKGAIFYRDEEISTSSAGSWFTLASASLTPAFGKPVTIEFSAFFRCTDDASTTCLIRLMRDDGVAVWGGSPGSRMRIDEEGRTVSFSVPDGSVKDRETTWTVQIKRESGATETVAVKYRCLRVEENSRLAYDTFDIESTVSGEGPTEGTGGGGGALYDPNKLLPQE